MWGLTGSSSPGLSNEYRNRVEGDMDVLDLVVFISYDEQRNAWLGIDADDNQVLSFTFEGVVAFLENRNSEQEIEITGLDIRKIAPVLKDNWNLRIVPQREPPIYQAILEAAKPFIGRINIGIGTSDHLKHTFQNVLRNRLMASETLSQLIGQIDIDVVQDPIDPSRLTFSFKVLGEARQGKWDMLRRYAHLERHFPAATWQDGPPWKT